MHLDLASIGWTPYFEATFAEFRDRGFVPGRVAVERRKSLDVWTAEGTVRAEVSGRLRHDSDSRADFPVVGDWVALAPAREGTFSIQTVLERRSAFRRKAAGSRTEEQVVAANVDTVFLVTGLDGDYNLRRIERYLTVAWDSGAQPVVLLNKSDVCDDLAARVAEVEAVAPGVDVLALSAVEDEQMDALLPYLVAGSTVALLGSSGVGKSTISNRLLETAVMRTGDVREHDSRGRHTTTHRAMFMLPSGAMLIDTPGMRELQIWSTGSGLDATFEDVASFAADCRFSNCGHAGEPGCAVEAAIESGELDAARYASYVSLAREARHVAIKQDQRLQLDEKKRVKAIHKAMRNNEKR